jgi:hypothetical protein
MASGTGSNPEKSESRYSSHLIIKLNFSPQPTANTQPLVANSDIVTYLAIGVIAIIIAIAIVGALILRKR